MLVNSSKTDVPLWPSDEGAGLIYSAWSPLLASKLHRRCQADTPASKPLQREPGKYRRRLQQLPASALSAACETCW